MNPNIYASGVIYTCPVSPVIVNCERYVYAYVANDIVCGDGNAAKAAAIAVYKSLSV